jgi:hypothetical protein
MKTIRLTLTAILTTWLVGAAAPSMSFAQWPNEQVSKAQLAKVQGPLKPASLAELIDADSASSKSPKPTGSDDPASSEIEPLPGQASLFGRLGNEQSKLPDDDFLFYEATDKQLEGTTRQSLLPESDAAPLVIWSDEVFTWAAPNLFHQPLYFEEPNLERYGVGPRRILHAPISAAHFFTNIAVLPYQVASTPPRTRHYTLGHYRPGDRVPYRFHRAPFSVKGFVAQGAVAAGIVLIP